MAKIIATTCGVVLALFGVAGFFAPTFLGALCSPVHNFIHILAGATVVYLAQRSGAALVFWATVGLGLGYLACGLTGFALGHPSASGLAGVPPDDRLLVVVPKVLELGRSNHVLNLFFGVALLTAAVVSATETPFRLRK